MLDTEKEEKTIIKRELKNANKELKTIIKELRASNDGLTDKANQQKEEINKWKGQIKDLYLKIDKANEINNKLQSDYEEIKEYTSLLENIKNDEKESKIYNLL